MAYVPSYAALASPKDKCVSFCTPRFLARSRRLPRHHHFYVDSVLKIRRSSDDVEVSPAAALLSIIIFTADEIRANLELIIFFSSSSTELIFRSF